MRNEEIEAPGGWIRVQNAQVLNRLGRIRHVLFDFDGTLSVLRQGWEDVMIPLMVEAICAAGGCVPEIEQEVRAYVDRSSGVLTIRQMQWLAETVQRYGTARTAVEYKALYLERLMIHVRERVARLARKETTPAENMVSGADAFISGLALRGARLYLASGTDHTDVVNEAHALGLLPFFEGGVYGALENDDSHAKERVIQRIVEENHLTGDELLVVGDGPVEIREGARRGALTLGVASNEVARRGWNTHKIHRLCEAGADLMVADFSRADDLIGFLYHRQAVPNLRDEGTL